MTGVTLEGVKEMMQTFLKQFNIAQNQRDK